MRLLLIDGNRRDQLESGYGRIAAALAEGLPKLGHEVQFGLSPGIDACLYTSPPYSMRKVHLPGVPRVGFTMHELEYLSEGKEDWPEILNGLDLVITPTEWNRRVWQQLGVTTPIEVVPLGIDPALYHPPGPRTCVFLAVHESLGSSGARENWADTLAAYAGAFSAEDPVELRIKTWKWQRDGWEPAQAEVADAAPVRVIDERLSHEQMRQLYLDATVFIKNANREGWSIPCTEAAACGTPIAASRIEPLLSILPARTRWFELGDRAALGSILREAYEDFRSLRADAGRYVIDGMVASTAAAIERHLSGDSVRQAE